MKLLMSLVLGLVLSSNVFAKSDNSAEIKLGVFGALLIQISPSLGGVFLGSVSTMVASTFTLRNLIVDKGLAQVALDYDQYLATGIKSPLLQELFTKVLEVNPELTEENL